MTLTVADKRFYADQIRMAIDNLNVRYGIYVPMPVIQWTLRGQGRMGVAFGFKSIKLHPEYAVAMGREAYLQVAIHEACHTVTTWRRHYIAKLPRQKDGRWSSHGLEWKSAMENLGRTPERCGSTTAEVRAQVKPGRVVKKVHAECACYAGHEITLNVANKVARGAGYRCRRCHTNITVKL